jgi:hypothetical protein
MLFGAAVKQLVEESTNGLVQASLFTHLDIKSKPNKVYSDCLDFPLIYLSFPSQFPQNTFTSYSPIL